MSAIALIAFAICFLILPPNVKGRDIDCAYGRTYLSYLTETSSTNAGRLAQVECREPYVIAAVGSHDISSHFKLERVWGRLFYVFLSKPIILDFIRDVQRTSSGAVDMYYYVNCTCLTITSSFTFRFRLIISPADNYPPEFRPNITLDLTEDTPVGANVVNIRDQVIDRDYPDYTRITNFSIHDDPNSQNDGYGIFQISPLGNITLSKSLDYDKGIRTYQLKVSATNNIKQTANGTVTVNVINVNDSPVRFVYKNCTSDCIYKLNPWDPNQDPEICAVDVDNDPIEYSISTVLPVTEIGIMTINKTTGKLRQRKHPNDSNLRTLTLIIKAQVTSPLPSARNVTILSPHEDFAIVKINFESLSMSVSGSDQILVGNVHVPVCLIMMYVISKHVI